MALSTLIKMRKSLLVAASLFASVSGASLIESVKAGPQFEVAAGTPGAIVFQGSGTTQFNNSIGTNNSFQVGSSTNLGVNASTSSTAEYGVASQAKLDLAGTSTLKQVIGTSGTSQTQTNTATAAHDVALDVMSSWSGGSSWEYGNSNGYSSEAEWQADYDREYNVAYQNAYSNIQEAQTSQGSSGTISGEFTTKESGAARTSGSMADWSASAGVAAEAKYGREFEAGGGNYNYDFSSEAEWQAAYDAEYNRAYGSAAAGAARSSESTVTVNGIGSDATVQASDSSTFDVSITQNDGQDFGSTATANGSAGASLATSSFANQSQSSTASGFMQAFGGSATIAPIGLDLGIDDGG